ncbi:GDP-mannose-dependent alpha-(1-6)-phosphatidylinositol monomannoside mannosyltransferase [Planctomycetes bacterium Poly30]|uniref:GDP-mannose-dependent alpha-(1-6)-phosphatidylinositol monomannoside mannosyltransferase n=1 Tax=Saltatorellus ferox TaxID=2528018 RepID=A0A518ERT9_9BACT|nr:GDP-mannose-dependent alpha-(1-6)-phosphatidylinositol monomannoside mannosyltransferase [Planctomycetes bacterium Poly30]
MKVVFLTDSLSDLDGVGRYAVRLISAMEALRPGLEVHVLLARKHRPTSADVPGHWKVEVALPPDYFFYMTPARFAVWRFIGTRNTKRAARDAALVHAIKDFPHSLIAVDAADRAGIPCVATGHGTYTIQPVVSDRHKRTALKAYRRFASLISVSRYTRKRLLALVPPEILPPERVHVVPNAVDAESYVEPVALEGGERPWHGKRFTLGIGELKERKGHHLGLEAWARRAARDGDLHHFLVGHRAGDDYERSLAAIAERHGVRDRLHLLGNVSEKEKIDLLQRASVFLHTPVTAADGGFEGFGIVYLEAAAAGTTAIGSLDSGAEDAIVDGVSGLLVEQNVDAVLAALDSVLDDPVRRESLESGGRAHAERSSWEENARAVLAIYDQALAKSSVRDRKKRPSS